MLVVVAVSTEGVESKTEGAVLIEDTTPDFQATVQAVAVTVSG